MESNFNQLFYFKKSNIILRLMQEKEKTKIVGVFFTAVTLKYVILLWIANLMLYTQ